MFWELAKKYSDWDITIVYNTGSKEQVNRLRKYVRVERLDKSKKIECEKAFFNYQLALEYFEAKEYWQILHADYKQQGIAPNLNEKLTGYIAVSNTVAKSFKELTGIDAIVCFNPITILPEDMVLPLNLISATRLTKEKGKARMEALARKLNESGIIYYWDIYTNDKTPINVPNVNYKTPTLNIRPYIAKADLVVQLSDSEGWCYTINEALCLGTPVLTTPIPSLKEMGGDNIIYLDFDLANINDVIEQLTQLVKKKPIPEFKPKKDIWDKLLVPGKTTYITEERVRTVAIKKYFDIELQEMVEEGDINTFNLSRANELKEKGLIVII